MTAFSAFLNERNAVKGMRDIRPPATGRWAFVEAKCRQLFASYGYEEIRTPIVEFESLFARSVGGTTDIVSKEMFTLLDRKGRKLALRPENTAGVVRAIIEHRLTNGPMPLRLWYVGSQFRYERPQKLRYRQFNQIGAELFGAPGPSGDAELISMLYKFLVLLRIEGLQLRLNCIGTGIAREHFVQALRNHLRPYADRLSPDDARRLNENPLRLFDSKDVMTQGALQGAPRPIDFLDQKGALDFQTLQDHLSGLGVPFVVDPGVVRGLDYYTTTVFEITSGGLGSQDALAGGGRYDDLVQALGGPPLAAVGFAIGQDRLLEVASLKQNKSRRLVVVIPHSPLEFDYALKVAEIIRQHSPTNTTVETDLSGRGFKKALARVNSTFIDANISDSESILDFEKINVAIVGSQERLESAATVKNLETGRQEKVPLSSLPTYFKDPGA